MTNNLLTVEQAASEYRLSVPRLRDWILYGKLSKVKQGKAVYVQRGELVSLLEAHCVLCGEPFTRGKLSQRYCSVACRQAAYRLRQG